MGGRTSSAWLGGGLGTMTPDGEHGQRGRRHTRDARSLTERPRSYLAEPLAYLGGETGHRQEVERDWDQLRLEFLEARHVVEHSPNVALVFRGDFDLPRDRRLGDRARIDPLYVGVGHPGPPEQLEHPQTAHVRRLETPDLCRRLRATALDRLVTLGRHQTQPVAVWREAQVGVVLA